MANTGGLGFEPVLHNITPEQVVFCYRQGDSDSLEVAQYYRDLRGIPEENLIPLPCNTDNVIYESEYVATIETPLINAIENLGNDFDSMGNRAIWVIILGYNIPHAYYREDEPYGDIIAVASRLHRLGFDAEYKKSNYTYDRRGQWKFFDLDDARNLMITAVIDAPTVSAAKRLIDRSIDVDNQTFITGKIYLDPYGKKQTEDQLNFQADILDFVANELNFLGLDHEITVDTFDPYSEPMIAAFNNDSFYWGWYTPRYASNLFLNQNERRVFLYNADDDAAYNIKDNLSGGSDPWCNIAINIEPGYAACAGSVASPGEDAYLRPRPFFEALHRGATIGEAFLFSSPYINWKIILIGDPLLVVNFPSDIPTDQDESDDSLPNHEVIRRIKLNIEDSLGWGLRQTLLTQDLVDTNVASSNFAEELELLRPLVSWRDHRSMESYQNLISVVVSDFLSYILKTDGRTLNDWLQVNREKISRLFNSMIQTMASDTVSSDYVYPEGHWEYELVYIHEFLTYENIHFEIEVHNNNDYSSLEVSVNSYNDNGGWKYESEPFVFVQMPETGFPSNFSGRRVRYEAFSSSEYLTTASIYYVRWRALDASGSVLTDWTNDTNGMIVVR